MLLVKPLAPLSSCETSSLRIILALNRDRNGFQTWFYKVFQCWQILENRIKEYRKNATINQFFKEQTFNFGFKIYNMSEWTNQLIKEESQQHSSDFTFFSAYFEQLFMRNSSHNFNTPKWAVNVDWKPTNIRKISYRNNNEESLNTVKKF